MALERNVKKKPARTADRRNMWLLILTTLLIVVSVVLFTPPNEKINQGLDIQGGLSVVLTAKSTDGAPVTPEDMEKSRAIIESRVNALGASEATVQEQGNDQILVQIPGLADTEEALATIGRTGSLEFARLDSFTDEDVKNAIDSGQTSGEGTVTDEFGNAFPSGQVEHMAVEAGTYTPIVTGADITNVTIGRESEGSTYYSVNITLNSQGAKAFADASRDLVADHGKIVIILDGEVQSAPAVQSEIPNGEVSITGQYSLEDAKALQTILESGSLPVSFEYAQSQVVGPTLGQDALVSGVVVALIGLAVVMLYLLFFYKGLGVITAAAMAIGLIAGSYSSIAIACPLYCMWKTREPKFAKLQKKYGTEVGLFEFDHSASTGIAQVPLARLEANARAEAYVAEQKEATGEAPDAAAVAAAVKPKPVNNKKKKHRHGRAQ